MEVPERFFLPAWLPFVADVNFSGSNDPNRTAATGAPEYTLFWDITPVPRQFRE